MADMKIPASVPAPVARPMSGARAEAIRSAQKAFFQAALSEAQLSKPETGPAKARAPSAAESTTEVQPQRFSRPGSRLDIKV